MWIATGQYDPEFFMSGRPESEPLRNNYYICYENVQSNIEAILDNCPRPNNTNIKFQFYRRSSSSLSSSYTSLRNRTERIASYFLYSANDYQQIKGVTMDVGKYQIVSYPAQYPSTRRIVNFDMIYCAYYLPANQCHKCPGTNAGVSQTCEGSQCVTTSPNGVRFVLLTYGQDTYDFGMNITSPVGTTLSAFYPSTSTTDDGTGGYVQKDYMETSCRSTGVWIKNIVYPNYIPGTYSMTLQNILKCTFLGPPFFGLPPANQNRYEIKVYKKEQLVQTVASTTDPTGIIYVFNL